MTNEEKELIKAAKRNLKLMRACKEILEDINKINKTLDGKNKNKKKKRGNFNMSKK